MPTTITSPDNGRTLVITITMSVIPSTSLPSQAMAIIKNNALANVPAELKADKVAQYWQTLRRQLLLLMEAQVGGFGSINELQAALSVAESTPAWDPTV